MALISPSLTREYLTCPRSFMFNKKLNLSLFPTKLMEDAIYAQDRIEKITYAFFAFLNDEIREKGKLREENDLKLLINSKLHLNYDLVSHPNNRFIQELDEKVLSLLYWITTQFWNDLFSQNRNIPYYESVLINQYIKAPELNLHGRPSVVIIQPDNRVLLFIHTYQFTSPYLKDLPNLQIAIYARILDSLGLKMSEYLHVNYYSMIIKRKKLVNNPLCAICEYNIICQMRNE
ncbi:MAG: hypothetical protein ACW964_07180 [Candidatus Hodarchaeales archaeon]